MTTNPAFLEICAEVRGGVQEIPICVSKSRIIRSSEEENNCLTRNIQSTGRGPGKSHKKAPKRLLVAPSQNVASLISNSHILGSQPASEPAKRMTGLFYTRSVSLGMLGRLGEAWGGLGNASGRLGEAWECFGEDWGGRRTAHNARSTSPA